MEQNVLYDLTAQPGFRETPGVKSCKGGIICLPSEQLYEGVDKENQMGCVQS